MKTIFIGMIAGWLGLTMWRVAKLSVRANDIEKRLLDVERRVIVATAFASVARDIARRIDGTK